MNIGKRFVWVSAYAVAMAFMEAVVVVYIRGLLRITNDHVALGPYVTMETGREAATIVMLVAVGWLAGRVAVGAPAAPVLMSASPPWPSSTAAKRWTGHSPRAVQRSR